MPGSVECELRFPGVLSPCQIDDAASYPIGFGILVNVRRGLGVERERER
jgi:hypothetical protein